MNYKDFSKKHLEAFETRYNDFLNSEKNNVSDVFLKYCYDLIIAYSAGGKRIRPMMLMMSYLSKGGKDIKKIMLPAISIELYHTYTLILDDLMDEDDFRRKKPTVHRNLKEYYLKNFKEQQYDGKLYNSKSVRFCISLGILIGNLTGTLSRLALHRSEFSIDQRLSSLYLMERLDQWMCYGQSLDNYKENSDIKESEYIELATYKTGVLFGVSLQIGALFADADENIQNQFFEFGKLMAIAFQIQDDLLDLTDAKGHEIGSDIKKGKRTLIYIKAFEKEKSIKNLVGKLEIFPALKIMKDTGAIDYANRFAKKKIEESKDLLKSLDLDSNHESLFIDLLDFLIIRAV